MNKSWRQHPTRHQLYGHLPPITKTIQVRRTRHAGHCWRSKDELISDVLLWTPTYGQAKAGRPAWTYIQQLCEDTGCNPEDLPEAMNDREKWRERLRDICAGGTTWWWWWCCNRDEMGNHNVSEYNKLIQKEYKSRHNWVEKMFHLELCKTLKFDHANKWYTYKKTESVLENEMHKIFWDLRYKQITQYQLEDQT